jgi:hypothetical protein
MTKTDDKTLVQGIVLVVLVLIGVVYAHVTFLVGPIRSESEKLQAKMAEAQARLDIDKPELRKLLNEEQNDARNLPVENLVNRMLGTVPRVPMVECPSILSKWAQRHDLQGTKIGLKAFLPFPGVQTATLQNWNLHAAAVKPIAVGEAVADLESQLPMAQISEFSIARPRGELAVQADFTIQFTILK